MGRIAWMGVFACLAAGPAWAEVPPECVELYQEAGASPGSQSCRDDASNAQFGLGTYHCENPRIIDEYCGGVVLPPWDPGKNNQCDVTTGATQVGNPINALLGIKVQTETDVSDASGHLSLQRHYNSLSIDSNPGIELGPRWRHSFQISLATADEGAVLVRRLNLPSGDSYRFVGQDQDVWLPDADVRERLKVVKQNGTQTGWEVAGDDDTRYQFNLDGKLVRISYVDGDVLSLRYTSSGALRDVTDRRGRRLSMSYSSGRLSTVTRPDGRTVKYVYTQQNLSRVRYDTTEGASATFSTVGYAYTDSDDPLLLTGIVDETGQAFANWEYDTQGRAVASWHGGLDSPIDRVSVSYGSQQSQVTNALGNTTTYAYTLALGRAKQTSIDQLCSQCGGSQISQRSYDANGYPDVLTDFNGVTTDEDYDARGLLTQQISASNDTQGYRRTIQTDWHPQFRVPIERRIYDAADVPVSRWTWAYNARGQAVGATSHDPASSLARTTTTTYCEQADVNAGNCPFVGLLTSIKGPRSDVAELTTYQYYASDDAACAGTPTTCPHRKGDLWKVSNALGHITEYLAYDGAGRVLSMRDANGVVTDYGYHPRGWLSTRIVRGPDDSSPAYYQITRFDYWPNGLVKQATQPDGAFVVFTYDAAKRLTSIADNAGNTRQYTLDNAGNRVTEDTLDASGALTHTLSRIYDQLGQLTTLATSSGDPTDIGYDANGNATQVTDALGRRTQLGYDPLNRLASTLQDVDGVAAEIRSQYNALDQVTQVTDPKGLHTTYAYNGFGDLTGQVSPDSGASSFTVDAAGNRKTATDARSVTATYHYDALNRLIGVAYPDPNLDVGYNYDVAPAVCAADERFAKGRLGQVLHANGSTQYCHDRFGQVTRKVQTLNGVASTLRYAYSKAGRLTALTYPDGSVADYVRDTQGRISQIGLSRPGQARQIVVNNVTYAALGPATGWTYGNGRQLQRPLDLDYRPQAVHDPAAGGLSLGYGYDPVGSITELKNGAGSTVLAQYAYDTLGRLTQTQDGTTGTPIETYTYDATGNRTALTTSAGIASYTYPATSHRLTAVDGEVRSHDAAGNTTGIGGKTFTYNDANRMNAVKQGDAVLESYAYNHRGERVLRTPAGGAAQITLYDEAGQWLGNYSATGQAQQQAIWLDNYPVALINVPATGVPELAYVQPDHLGTPRVVIDPVRDVAIWEWSNKSEVFGNQIPSADPDSDGVAFELALRFPGQQATAASGLFYNYQREYDPAVGRYSQSDPIGLMGGISTYGYSAARPTDRIDELGLKASCKCTKEGAKITVKLKFKGEAASDSARITSLLSSVERSWSAPGFDVKTKIGGIGATEVNLLPGKGRSNRINWYTGEDTWVASHEVGHIMKLGDRYIEDRPGHTTPQPGWEGTVMAEHLGEVTPADRQGVLNALGCNCDCGG
ncbi:RHS repeat-associated core domain-containing protein [Stenotrophomonas muris]|uniref:RHS repeat-associated core domain-containing protein n=1 Tax=Stenotrophomonas muris TaxID=2963283 RepID=UPI00300E7E8D